MSDKDSLDLPRDLGPYILLRRLAVGGMAEVYVAKKQGIVDFEKYVAIKVIHPRYSEDEHFVKLLVEEAKIAVQLGHVNIAQIFDLGVADGTYFIAMEYVEGVDAYRLMRRASEHKLSLPLEVCAHIVAETCNGLDYAHRKRDGNGKPLGIVHRDVSPQNVLVSFAGEVKIVDFGIAKAALREGQTEAGVIKGKYYYMSPEQAWGDPMDHRTDVFSTGVVLYELITGEMLYREDNVPLLLDKVRKAEVSRPEKKRPEMPRELSDIVMKALAKEPADRFQSAHEMAQALVQFLYRASPSFTSARVVELMARLFPNEIKIASAASGMKVEAPKPAPKPAKPAPKPAPKPAATPLAEEGDDATRNDLPPFRKPQAAAAPAPAPSTEPSWTEEEDDETNVVDKDSWDDDSTTVDDAAGVMAKLASLYGSKAKREAAAKAAGGVPAAPPARPPPAAPAAPASAPPMPVPKPRVSAGPPPPRVSAAPQQAEPVPRPRVSAAPQQPQYAAVPQPKPEYAPAPQQYSQPPQQQSQPPQQQSQPPQQQSQPPQQQSQPPQQYSQPPQQYSQPPQPTPSFAPQPPQAPGMPWPASPPDPFAPPPTGAAPQGQRAIPTSVYAAQPGDKSPWPRIVALAALLVVVVTGVAIWLVLDPGNEPSPGVIEVVSVPAGAHLRIDSRDVDGMTPLRVRDTPGTPRARHLEVTLDGYVPWSGDLLPKQDEIVTQVVVLTRLAVQLRVDSSPPGATLHVGAGAVGVAPLDVQVPPGPLEVRAQWPDRPEVRQMVDVQPGGAVTVTITAP